MDKIEPVDLLAVLDQAAAALKYAGARREGVERVIEARASVSALLSENARLREACVKFAEYEQLMESGDHIAGMVAYAEASRLNSAALSAPEDA